MPTPPHLVQCVVWLANVNYCPFLAFLVSFWMMSTTHNLAKIIYYRNMPYNA